MTTFNLSEMNSPVVSLLMIMVLSILALFVRKESKKILTALILQITGFLLMLVPDFIFIFQGRTADIWFNGVFPVIKLSLIIPAMVSLFISLRQLKEKIYHLDDKFHKVFNTSPHAMVINTLSDGIIQEVNSAFERISGKTAAEVIGKTAIGMGMYYDPEQRNEMISILKEKHKVGPMEIKYIIQGTPRKFLYSAQLIIIKGKQFLIAHIEQKSDRSHIGDETKNLLKNKLDELMSGQALFKNPELSLTELAQRLETNKTYLSQTINSEYGNFNEYVNKLRVIEACRMIQNGIDPRLSIDHLYAEVGFASRTTFYEAFKKFTGVSPSLFRQINGPKESGG